MRERKVRSLIYTIHIVMTSLLGKSTLYDTLACIIPGYLLLLWGKLLFTTNITLKINDINIAIGIFTLSYLTGLLLKWIMEVLLNRFLRNRPNRIRQAYNRSQCIFEKKHLPDNVNELMKQYYIAYYRAMKGNPNSSIPILEAQIAFLRSILPVALLYVFTFCYWHDNIGHVYCLVLFFSIVIIIGCSYLMWRLQGKLHQLVWEDEYYINLENKSC